MRSVVNISLPEELAKVVSKEVKKGKFASKSEFFRHLLRTHQLGEELKKRRDAFDAGKGKVLKSLRDLR